MKKGDKVKLVTGTSEIRITSVRYDQELAKVAQYAGIDLSKIETPMLESQK